MNTLLFSSKTGDIDFPMTPTTLDQMALGINSPITALVLNNPPSGSGFVPSARYCLLTEVSTDAGLPLAATSASGTTPGIARTAGTSLALVGAATSGATPATTKMLWEQVLPMTYVAGSNIPVYINCVVPTALDVTAASTTMTVAAYSLSESGVETALTVSSAQQIPLTTAGTLTFTITGTGLVAGQRISLELTALVTTTVGGASSVQVNSVGYAA